MIQLTGVTVIFQSPSGDVTALESIDLTVGAGELIILRGRSGSGKSTLLSAIAGLERLTRGSILVGDLHVESASEKQLAHMRLNKLGIVFQENNLIPEFNAIENVQLPLRARGMTRAESRAAALESLSVLEVGPLAERRPAQLSGGQKQRIGIARAIVGGKHYLLADEPTGALDNATADRVFETMRKLADRGLAVVVASHDARAEDFADRVVQLDDGRVSASRTRVGVGRL